MEFEIDRWIDSVSAVMWVLYKSVVVRRKLRWFLIHQLKHLEEELKVMSSEERLKQLDERFTVRESLGKSN